MVGVGEGVNVGNGVNVGIGVGADCDSTEVCAFKIPTVLIKINNNIIDICDFIS